MGVRDVFDRSAQGYDQNRRKLVPCFDDFYGAALDAIPAGPQPLRVVDLGAGTGLLSLFVADALPRASLRLVDVAPRMLDRARARFAGREQEFCFEVADLADLELPDSLDCVVSALAIHHLDAAGKARLFDAVFRALRPGGVFVNADQIAGKTPVEDAAQRQQWLDETRAAGVSDDELHVALGRMEEDQPSSIDEQLGWLREAGFADVRCEFHHAMFAVMAARRPRPGA